MILKKHTLRTLSALMVLFGVIFTAQAQRFSAAAVGGLNASQIDGDLLAGFDKVGLTGGLKAVVNFESAFDVHIEFLYTQRGSQPDLFNPEFDPDIKITLDYIELPVLVTIGDWWQEEGQYHKVSAHGGLSLARLINARTFDYFHSEDESFDLLVPYFNDYDLSWLLGVSFRMSEKFGITGRYTRSLTPLLSPEKHNLPFERLISYYMTFRLEYYF
jgi:hypothetical protein